MTYERTMPFCFIDRRRRLKGFSASLYAREVALGEDWCGAEESTIRTHRPRERVPARLTRR
jgi:hypothetical protein